MNCKWRMYLYILILTISQMETMESSLSKWLVANNMRPLLFEYTVHEKVYYPSWLFEQYRKTENTSSKFHKVQRHFSFSFNGKNRCNFCGTKIVLNIFLSALVIYDNYLTFLKHSSLQKMLQPTGVPIIYKYL